MPRALLLPLFMFAFLFFVSGCYQPKEEPVAEVPEIELTDYSEFRIIQKGNQKILTQYTGSDKDVAIPEGVTGIGYEAFNGCSSLTSVVIPEGVTEIDSDAFEDCPKLTIHAPKGSEAEKYAKEQNIPFQVIE